MRFRSVLLSGVGAVLVGGAALGFSLRGQSDASAAETDLVPIEVVDEASGQDASATAVVRPWARRFARSCTEWGRRDVVATERHVFTCEGAAFERETGELVGVLPHDRFGGRAVSGGSVWRSFEHQALLFLDHELRVAARVPVDRSVHAVAGGLGGDRVLAIGDSLHVVDVATRRVAPVEGSEVCDGALEFGFRADGRIQCMVPCEDGEECLRTIGESTAVRLPDVQFARWDAEGRSIFALGFEDAYWLGVDGTVEAQVHLGETEDRRILGLAPSGRRALVGLLRGRGESGGRVDMLTRDAGEVRVEPLVEIGATEGAFVGEDQVVIGTLSSDLLWLHRGEPAVLPPTPLPVMPEGFAVRRPVMDGPVMTFGGEDGSMITRDLTDVAAFDAPELYVSVTVSRSDAAEFARFDDDTAWGRMVAARYLADGSERWAIVTRDGDQRVLRGHYFIGGCERTHTDVVVRERGAVLERLEVHTGTVQRNREARVERALGPVPEGTSLLDPEASGYAGDPSVGRLTP